MKYAIICGSHRQNSESLNVGYYLKHQIEKNKEDKATILDLASSNIPLWDESIWEGDPKWDQIWGDHSEMLAESEAVIIVTPEWNGMVTPTLKNFFLLCSSGELAHKPGCGLLVSHPGLLNIPNSFPRNVWERGGMPQPWSNFLATLFGR